MPEPMRANRNATRYRATIGMNFCASSVCSATNEIGSPMSLRPSRLMSTTM